MSLRKGAGAEDAHVTNEYENSREQGSNNSVAGVENTNK